MSKCVNFLNHAITRSVFEEALKRQAVADSEYQAQTRVTDARVYDRVEFAKAEAQASGVLATQDAENTRKRAEAKAEEIRVVTAAYDTCQNEQTHRIMLAELDVAKHAALPAKTIYFAGSVSNANVGAGFATTLGAKMALENK